MSRLQPRIMSLIEHLNNSKYDLDEQSFQENEINDPWAVNLVTSILEILHERYKVDIFFFPLYQINFCDISFSEKKNSLSQKNITKSNYALLTEILIDFLGLEIERSLRAKTFSLLGAIQVEKEIKLLIDNFSEDARKSMRHKFSKLTQISYVLNIEHPNHLIDVWNSVDIQWKINTDEIKEWVSKRKEFAREDVLKLNLPSRHANSSNKNVNSSNNNTGENQQTGPISSNNDPNQNQTNLIPTPSKTIKSLNV